MKITRLILGEFATNTYVIVTDGKAAVIDPAGDDSGKIITTIGDAKLTHILLTHGHFDHTSLANELRELTGAKIYIHENDAPMLDDIKKSFGILIPNLFNSCQADVILKDGDIANVGEIQMKVIATPGHSGGSVMYVAEDVIFSGDTLFAGSVGRIDGWSGDRRAQKESLVRIKEMQGDYRIFPGHGDDTTLERERQSNPYLK